MPELNFHVERAEPEPFAAAPTLIFKLRIDQADAGASVHAIALRCQIRIEPARRRYSEQQKQSLLELFGRPSLWAQSLRPMLWTHTSAIVPAFASSTLADLPVPCTWDFNLAATKYFDALCDDGEVPLCLLFSGTVFYETESRPLQAAPISWDKETTFRLPVRVWRDMMQQYYPNTAWLSLRKDLFDRLRAFKTQGGYLSIEQALEELLLACEQQKVPG